VKIRQDLGTIEELLEQPGDLTVIATVRLLKKSERVFIEIEADQGVSRRVLKKVLRRASLELPNQP
jgi:hypothetical protein